MPNLRHLRLVLPALLLCAGQPAFAAATTADAVDLQTQLHDWLSGLVAPLMPAELQPVTVTPDGDGFRLRVESPASLDDNIPHGSALTLKATRTEDGMWALDDFTMPSPLVITLPAPKTPPAAPSQPATPPVPAQPTVWRLNTAKTDYHGLFDPTLTRPSHFETTREASTTQTGVGETHVGKTSASTDWTPTGGGLLDVASHSSTEEMNERFMQPNGTPGELAWTHSESHSQISGLSPAQLRTAIQTISQMIAQAKKAPQTPPGRDQVMAIFDSLFGIADSMTAEGDVSGLAMRFQPVVFAVDNAHLSTSLNSQDGSPHLQTKIAVDGLQVPSIATGVWQELMPHDIAFAFSGGGVTKERLRQFLLASLDFPPGPAGAQARSQAIAQLMAGGADYAIDELAFNLGETTLHGQGRMHWAGPNQITATADIEATDLDKLTARASTEPQLGQMLPALVIARGLAKQDGDKLRWHIDFANNVLLVNGADLRALMQPAQPRPGAAGPNASPARPAPTLPPPSKP